MKHLHAYKILSQLRFPNYIFYAVNFINSHRFEKALNRDYSSHISLLESKLLHQKDFTKHQ